MKRYKFKQKIVPLSPINDVYRNAVICQDPIEHPKGKWIKWEDHKAEMNRAGFFVECDKMAKDLDREIRRFKKTLQEKAEEDYSDLYAITYNNQGCNCEEKGALATEIKWEDSARLTHWICPAHGYKRR